MHSRFKSFRASPLGQRLEMLIDTPVRYIEYRAYSRIDVPAVAGLVADLRKDFPEVESDKTARQFCGAMVAEVMRRHGHSLVREKARVPTGYFTTGAVWSAEPE